MIKKLLVILSSLFFLAACGKSGDDVKIDFKGPITPPDLTKIKPAYGPNDPVPANPPIEQPTQPSEE
jgi:hypothetical protein